MDGAKRRSATGPAMFPRYPSSAIPDKYYYQEWHFLRPSRQSTFTLGVKPEKKTQKHAVSQLDIAIALRTNQPRRKTWISYWMVGAPCYRNIELANIIAQQPRYI